MRLLISFWMVAMTLLGAPDARAAGTLFADDFSTDPTTSGKWTVVTENSPLTAYDAAGQSFYLNRSGTGGAIYSGMYMLANTSLTTHKWEATFRYRVSNPYHSGGDGLTFMFYKKGGYTPGFGGYLGFNPVSSPQPGYGVIIDNWANPGWDPSGNYIGLIANTTYTYSDKLAWVNDSRTEDGVWHDMKVRFIDGQVTVFVDGAQLFSYLIAAPDYTFDGVGFSSGTADAQNDHQIDDFALVNLENLEAAAWTATGSMTLPRQGHTATLLSTGQVLVTGGTNGTQALQSAELYDPRTGTWTQTGAMNTPRFYHTATLLDGDRVLVVGGFSTQAHTSAEIYDPLTGEWSYVASLDTPRYHHTATRLSWGGVLITGGLNRYDQLSNVELYLPGSNQWMYQGDMAAIRYQHTATLLPQDKVLVTGGKGTSSNTAEIFDPITGKFTPAGTMGSARSSHTATMLPSGKVLIAGGDMNPGSTDSTELFDPATLTWASAGYMGEPRAGHTATLLANGTVLIAGGTNGSGTLATAELYDPATGLWSPISPMISPKEGHTAVRLSSGEVVVTGGTTAGAPSSGAELYIP